MENSNNIQNEQNLAMYSSIIDLDTNFNVESFRLVSLASWTNSHVAKEKLARFGFYHALQNDHVKCYFCEVVIGDWGIGDDPLTEHYKHSPNCPLINMVPTNNIPLGDVKEFNDELAKLNKTENCLVPFLGDKRNIMENIIHIPRHPDYAPLEKRLQSFANWPKSMKQTAEDLSEAGFFYLGVGDEVKCFHCAGCLKDWEPNDLGLEEHKKHFEFKCGFIQENYHTIKKLMSKNMSPKELVKATPNQINSLIDYMNHNTDLRDGKVNSANNKDSYIAMWEDLVSLLNKLHGPKKTIKAWREVWRNHKYNKKRKPNQINKFEPGVIEENNEEANLLEWFENKEDESIQSYGNSHDTGQIKTVPKKRKYNETINTQTILFNSVANNRQLQMDLLNRAEFSSEWTQLVAQLNTGAEEKSAEEWADIWRNNYYEMKNQSPEILPEIKPTIIHHKSEIQQQTTESMFMENVPTAKVLPKKRKLQEYSKESEAETITDLRMESDIMEIKYKNLEYEKMQLEIENQKKQLEIEKLKMQLEFAETKRQLEIQKEELEKEKNRLAMERTSILIPIQANYD